MQSTPSPFTILIADDHDIYRDGLRLLLEKRPKIPCHIIGEAADGHELVQLAVTLKPDIILTDIKMPEMDGLEASRYLRQKGINTRIIALSSYDEDSLVYDMFEAGANGYLPKNTSKEELWDAIESVMAGVNFFSEKISRTLFKKIANSRLNTSNKEKVVLNRREKDILRMICEQKTTKEISSELGLSIRTIEDYSGIIKEKTGAKNSVGMALFAVKAGLFQI